MIAQPHIEFPRERWEEDGYTVAEHTGSPPVPWADIDTIVLHYPGAKSGIPDGTDPAAVIRKVRNTQRWYVDERHYSIGYSIELTGIGETVECRGDRWRQAATSGWNHRSMAIQFQVNGLGPDAPPANPAQIAAARAWIDWYQHRCNRKLDVLGHMDTKPTSCPGDAIERQIVAGVFDVPYPNEVVMGSYYARTAPWRLHDSRQGGGAVTGSIRIEVPDADGATAAHVNVTLVDAGTLEASWVTVRRPGDPMPAGSINNIGPRQPPSPNAVNVPLDAAGRFELVVGRGACHIVVDLLGVYR